MVCLIWGKKSQQNFSPSTLAESHYWWFSNRNVHRRMVARLSPRICSRPYKEAIRRKGFVFRCPGRVMNGNIAGGSET